MDPLRFQEIFLVASQQIYEYDAKNFVEKRIQRNMCVYNDR